MTAAVQRIEGRLRTLFATRGPVLALDSSGKTASLATFGCGGPVLREHQFADGVMPSESMVAAVAEQLEQHGLRVADLTAIVVSTGPGSFTGVRLALAFAKGLAVAAGIKLYGLSSLRMLAAAAGLGRVLVAVDAGRGGSYVGRYEVGEDGQARAIVPDTLLDAAQFTELLAAEQFQRVSVDSALEAAVSPDVDVEFSIHSGPRAAFGLLLAAGRIVAGEADDPGGLQPSYLQLSAAQRRAGAAGRGVLLPQP